ncbi:MAG: transcriptional regulator, IclR family [Sphingomonadales bacterium]|nr:transcriptional regulator, IclR family [Sphingomonadales bacterium]
MRVLAVVSAQPGPSTLSRIGQLADMSPSQTHRYLSSLMAAGVLKQDSASGLYDLDAGAIRFGLAALSRIDVFANADATAQGLIKRTRRTCMLCVMGDHGPTIVRWFAGSPPVITSLAIGSVLPLLRSATGRIFHTFGDRMEMDRLTHLIELNEPGAIPMGLEESRAEIEQALFTTIAGDMTPGLRAMSAPVFDLQGRLVLAVTLLAGSGFRSSEDEVIKEALIEACRNLTESLGGKWGQPAVANSEDAAKIEAP